MARSLANSHRLLGVTLVSFLAAGGCYYDSFTKVDAINDGSGASSNGGGGMGGTGTGGSSDSSGGNPMIVEEALAVEDVFFVRQGDDLTEDLLANDGGEDLRVIASDDADPDRPSSLDATDFSVNDAGLLRFQPHPDFWGTYRATYQIDDGDNTSTGDIIIHVEPEAISVATIEAGWGGIVIDGNTGDELGFSLAGINDFNGDGLDDFLIGAPGANGNTGRVAVVFGREDLSDLDLAETNENVQFYEGDGTTERAGLSVSSAGNINGDLFQDIIVGATGGGQAGRAYVIYGLGNPAGAPKAFKDDPTAIEGFTLVGTGGERAGRTVSGGGDLDGDGNDDVVVFADHNPGGPQPGTFYGVTTPANDDLATAADPAFIYQNEYITGPGFAMIGDVFGLDDRVEVMLPSLSTGADIFVALLRGQDGNGDSWPADGSFDGMDTSVGFKSTPFTPTTGAPSFASAGEFDGDPGIDLAYCAETNSCLVLTGNDLSSFDLDVGRTINGFTADPPRVAGGGNLDNDNFKDLVFAEPTTAYVLWGADSPPAATLDIADLDEEGFSIDPEGETIGEVAIIGDVNDDDIDDFAIAVPGYDGGKGRVYVVFGTITEAE